MMYCREFMLEAIRIARKNAAEGSGGPFGALVVKEGKIIASSGNTVVPDNDPTAHAEVNAIREACKVLGSFQLEGCEVYCSCEPCPMCFGAIYWARPDRVYYASSKSDAATGGFDDSLIYKEINLEASQRKIQFFHCPETGAGEEFETWLKTPSRKAY